MNAMLEVRDGPLAAIAAMAIVTLLLRISGYWFLSKFTLTPALRAGLEAIPVSIFVASVAPMALMAGPAGWIGAPVAAVAMYVTGREFLALGLAVAAAASMRGFGF